MEIDPFFAALDSTGKPSSRIGEPSPTLSSPDKVDRQKGPRGAGEVAVGGMHDDDKATVRGVFSPANQVPFQSMQNPPEVAIADANTAPAADGIAVTGPPRAAAAAATVVPPGQPASGKPGMGPTDEELLDAYSALAVLLQGNHIDQKHVSTLQSLTRENSLLKEKIAKLKNLLARSAKAQKDAKMELVSARNKLDESNKHIASLNAKVEQLANRPTHYLDLVADFESNFEHALHSIEIQRYQHQDEDERQQRQSQQQTVGEDSSSAMSTSASGAADAVGSVHVLPDTQGTVAEDSTILATPSSGTVEDAVLTNDDEANEEYKRQKTGLREKDDAGRSSTQLLVSELDEARARIEKLESLQTALMHRAAKLEKHNEELVEGNRRSESNVATLKSELKSSKAEAESAKVAMREKAASLAEMQLEIDLVTKASVDANARANNALMGAEHVRTDRKYVGDLESKVNALTEWALASAEAKKLAVERNRELENKLQELQINNDQLNAGAGTAGEGASSLSVKGAGSGPGRGTTNGERRLWIKTSSMVIGAGLAGHHVALLGEHEILAKEVVLLRWKFDLTPSDLDISFSIVKGNCPEKRDQDQAEPLLKNRKVLGGAGGEVEGAFNAGKACTLLWCNKASWVRPRTVKFTLEALAVR